MQVADMDGHAEAAVLGSRERPTHLKTARARFSMNELTEMKQRVLSELEEFWEENVFAMLNTVIEPAGARSEVELLQQALKGLVEHDYIIMGFENFHPRNPERLSKQASLELIARLQDWFRFDLEDPHWTLRKGDIKKDRMPMIYSTASGREKAFEILDQRGYQWWRQKK
jgi:hypothetical protein